MAVLPKQKIYQYDTNGKFLKTYESKSELLKSYSMTKGNLFGGKEYRRLPDNTYVTFKRIGRDRIVNLVRIDNCPYCHKSDPRSRTVEVYNLRNEKIAEFDSISTCAKMTGFNHSIILRQCNNPKTSHFRKTAPTGNLIFKFK